MDTKQKAIRWDIISLQVKLRKAEEKGDMTLVEIYKSQIATLRAKVRK